jgi:hypothetical protein
MVESWVDLAKGFDETVNDCHSPDELTALQETGLKVSDAGMVVTDPDACPVCGERALYEVSCKTLCGNCRCLIESCAD